MKCAGHLYGELGTAPVLREKMLLCAFPQKSVATQGGETFCNAITVLTGQDKHWDCANMIIKIMCILKASNAQKIGTALFFAFSPLNVEMLKQGK